MSGREGLDYNSVLAYLEKVAGIGKKERPLVFSCIQAMERAALDAWSSQINTA